ncbi:MAG: hypothetical protein GYB24_16895 [Rhodobacteraceae bacterium]|nr:hypothetical protein [Paracoccaceae bacterium]
MAKPPKLEKIKLSKLDDLIEANDPNTKYDDKGGDDLAVIGGSISDFSFETRGKKKVILTDDSGDVFEFKKVETLLFDGGTPGDTTDDVIYNLDLGTFTTLDTTLDSSGLTGTGNMLVGSGIPGSDFVVTRQEDAGVELGLGIRYRQGPAVDAVSVDNDGAIRFEVNTGGQSSVNGSSGNHAGRAAWSFQYSAITGLNGETTDLSGFTFVLKIDTDVTDGTDFRVLTMEPASFPNATGFVWVDQDGTPTIGDDGGNGNVAQNSENYAFGFINNFIDADPNTAGMQDYAASGFTEAEFDIILEAYDGNKLIADTHIVVDVIDM